MSEKQLPVMAWDCDDVLVLTGHDLVSQYNSLYGTNVLMANLYNHGASEEIWGTNRSEAGARVEAIIREERHELLGPDPEAVETVTDLAALFENHIVTSRSSEREVATNLMVETHFGDAIKKVHFANSYVPGVDPSKRRRKSEICTAINAVVAIDDNYAHCDDIISNSPVELSILYGNYDWNRDAVLDSRVLRCRTMDEVRAKVGDFAIRYAA